MNRLPKKRGITQVEEDKSLILRQNVGNTQKLQGMKIRIQNWMIRAPYLTCQSVTHTSPKSPQKYYG
jgi:hypothetical protein